MRKQVALVTGASRGLGRAVANLLISEGYKVYAGMRELRHPPKESIPVWVDLMKEESLHRCVETITSDNHKIDLLINNAGIAYYGGVDCMTSQEANDLFQVNFFGPRLLTQLFLPFFRKQMHGKILFISSIRVPDPCPYMGMYIASKSALEAIAYDWHETLAKWNISVSIVRPGPFNSGIKLEHGTYYASNENPYGAYGDFYLDMQPVEEVAGSIVRKVKSVSLPAVFETKDTGCE